MLEVYSDYFSCTYLKNNEKLRYKINGRRRRSFSLSFFVLQQYFFNFSIPCVQKNNFKKKEKEVQVKNPSHDRLVAQAQQILTAAHHHRRCLEHSLLQAHRHSRILAPPGSRRSDSFCSRPSWTEFERLLCVGSQCCCSREPACPLWASTAEDRAAAKSTAPSRASKAARAQAGQWCLTRRCLHAVHSSRYATKGKEKIRYREVFPLSFAWLFS